MKLGCKPGKAEMGPKVRTVFFMSGSGASEDGVTIRCNGPDPHRFG